MRKVVQIAATQDATNDPITTVIVLCDDGTIWRTWTEYGWRPWERLPAIPQTAARRVKNNDDA